MPNKFTAIYEDRWMSGSHMHSLVKILRFETNKSETPGEALRRLGIIEQTVFIFIGHPLLEGEENDQNFRSTGKIV